jgi:glycolate oxidase FAD binding subunit
MSSEYAAVGGRLNPRNGGYAVGGVRPSSVTTPLNVADLSAVMRHTATEGQSVGVCGAMSKIDQGAAPTSLDLLVATASMDRIVEHAAGDLVVTAQAGVPLARLQEHVAGARQWLALDPPEPGATVGGIVAAAASGPRRLLFGTPRDLLIGITVVLADGTVARSGGKVVKNVAGYDLGKLFTGSFGTLGVIAECTFRLHPSQPARRVVTVATDDPAGVADRVMTTGSVPSALEWDGHELTCVFESIESAAETQASEVAVAVAGSVSDSLPAHFGEHPWKVHVLGEFAPVGQVGLKVTHRLGALREVLAVVASRLPTSRVRAHVGSGVIWVGGDDGDVSGVPSLREAVAAYDGQVVIVEAPPEAKLGVDVWGPARGLDVMRRIKDQFDPDHRMSPGRFVGGL